MRSTELNEPLPISLAQIAEANVQRGTITIRSIGSADVVIKNRRLSSVPAELLEADRYQTARATYQYQPGRDDLGNEPAVTLAPAAATQAVSGTWAWHCRLDSRFANNHTTVHWATIGIQTAGASRLQVKFPQNARLHDAWIDDQRVPLASTSSAPRISQSNCRPVAPCARLTLYYATPGGLPTLAAAAERRCRGSTFRYWRSSGRSGCPGYRIPESSAQFPVDGLTQPTLMQRLFGILGRDGHSDTFNPLVAGDWQGALTSDAAADGQLAKGRRFVQSLGSTPVSNSPRAERRRSIGDNSSRLPSRTPSRVGPRCWSTPNNWPGSESPPSSNYCQRRMRRQRTSALACLALRKWRCSFGVTRSYSRQPRKRRRRRDRSLPATPR